MGLFRLGDLYNNCGRKNKSTRDAWLEKVLGQIPDGSKILDAGAGELQYKKYCDHLEYVSQDFGQYDGKGDSIGLQKTQGWDNTKLDIVSDITNIPVSDASFDAVMCIEVLEHIPEPILAIKEFYRILRGGTMILTAPVCSLTHFAPYYFYNGYSRYFYERILRENGFEIEELTYNGNWFEYIAQELHRLPYVLNRYSGFRGGRLLSLCIRIVLFPFFILLAKASARDAGSNELLSFGIHVRARKA